MNAPISVTALVPAFNEAQRIGVVLKVLKQCQVITQIIVIDDGSSDATGQVALSYGVQVIRNKINLGKSEAVKNAIQHIRNEVIFLCDADLIGLTPKICLDIIEPVITNTADLSIGLRYYGRFRNRLAIKLPSISGERVMRKTLLMTCAQSQYFQGFGLETVVNAFCSGHGLKIRRKVFPYHHVLDTVKRGWGHGFIWYSRQVYQLLHFSLAINIFGWK